MRRGTLSQYRQSGRHGSGKEHGRCAVNVNVSSFHLPAKLYVNIFECLSEVLEVGIAQYIFGVCSSQINVYYALRVMHVCALEKA